MRPVTHRAATLLVVALLPSLAQIAAAQFFDVTAASGVQWSHNSGAFGSRWLPETMGPGVVVLDANGDGRSDLLLVNGRNFPGKPGEATTSALYLNQGGMKFKDATREAGLDFSAYCLGGAAGDIDNDGDPDVYLSCLGQDRLLRNDAGRFVDMSREAGLSQEHEFGASVAFFDADHDGFLDIFATRYVTWTPETDVFCSQDGKTKAYCTPILYKGAASRYYHNRGNGTFEDKTRAAGLYLADGKMLGVVPVDVDGDGWTDLAVAGDTHPNLLFHNRGDGTFEEVGLLSGLAVAMDGRSRGGMGIAAGDYNRSGRPSLVITYFSNDMVGLYRNEGNVFFLDVATNSEVGRNTLLTLGWGTFFFDYDLDGWLDLLVANGHLDDEREKISNARVKYAQPQQLFRNQGYGNFTEVTEKAGGDLAHPLIARGAAFADLDEDGDLDIVVTTNGGPARIFENRRRNDNAWIRITLQGTASNRDGLGAEVRVTTQGATQVWSLHSGGSYLSQSQIDPTFGLGAAQRVDEIVVRWPSGAVQRLSGMLVNQRLRIVEAGEKRLPVRREATQGWRGGTGRGSALSARSACSSR
jgi:hypothetical protein